MGTEHVFKGYSFEPAGHEIGGFPPEAIALLDEAVAIRGWCVQSFAQVEFLLAALVEGAGSKFPDTYGHLCESMPFAPSKRPARVRALLAVEGPLKRHAPELERLMEEMASFEDLRHQMVHGWSDVLKTPSRLMLRWRRYEPNPGDPWHRVEVATTIETLREQGKQSNAFASAAVNYLRQLFLHYELEE